MSPAEALQQHLSLCEEIHQLALEENRFLKQNQRVPDSALLDRKKLLLGRLDASLAGLRSANVQLGTSGPDAESGIDKATMERARAKVMQILLLDKENEQLLFRYSLSSGPRPTPAQPAPSQLQRLYGRRS